MTSSSSKPIDPALVARAAAALAITPATIAKELADAQGKLHRGFRRLAEISEDDLAIATVPRDVVWREDMVTLFRCRPEAGAKPQGVPILITYALVGRYQMIDLEADRSLVRKLVASGFDVFFIDWGLPGRAQRFLTIDDYVSGYIDSCVDVIRRLSGQPKINLLGVCQGGVFSTCYAALFPDKVRNLALTVTPIDFHGDQKEPQSGSGYMNQWSRSLSPQDIDDLVEAYGSAPGAMVGFAFLLMNPISNLTKYTIDLIDVLDDDAKLLSFLRMERWIADRPDHPGEVLRQWFKDLYQGNKLIRNELELGGRTVRLDAITMPVLNIYATGDTVVPVCCTKGVGEHFGSKDYTEVAVPGGHIGTFVGGKAQKVLAPTLAEWFGKRGEAAAPGDLPATAPGVASARRRAPTTMRERSAG
ncbi:class III poly(R)-hydroxyalkanoic acid synthase subunit PhaC [Piscinibacter sakaiensis]|uniref:class III poly(R)-hydroxyalkanoic acid synthase subunit PhaC n=1 Tax=Piscinibacter sakaiensis TaxID=1547922 RepID=UPI003AAB651F